jgi:tetratricopeptide (TPR) repeat protein
LRQYGDQLDEILRNQKGKPYHYFEKGWMLFQTKNFAAAIAMFDRAMQMGTKNQYTYFYRGSSQRMLGKFKEA